VDEIVAIVKNEDILTTDEKTQLNTCINTTLYRWNYYKGNYAKYLKVASGSVTEEQIATVDTAIADCNALVARSEQRSETPYYFHADHLGSIRAITNGSGDIVEQYRYSVYGKPTIWNSTQNKYTAFSTSKIGNTRLYTGREYDNTTGLYYYRARYYSPILGRFISRDPIGYGDGVNAYRYVRNSPIGYNDPEGKWAHIAAGAVIGGIVNLWANWDNATSFWK
jgi:RHS repeat-associated protein